jgi:hypothetical protein
VLENIDWGWLLVRRFFWWPALPELQLLSMAILGIENRRLLRTLI